MLNSSHKTWLRSVARMSGSVRARTTLVAMAVVAAVLIAAVAWLASTVESTLTNRIQARGEALVDAVADRLNAGIPPESALEAALRTDDSADDDNEVPTYVAILDREGHPIFGNGFFSMPGVAETGGVTAVGGLGDPTIKVLADGKNLAVAQRSVEVDGELLIAVAASPMAEVVRSVEAIIGTSRVGVPLITLVTGIVTWLATGRTLRPIERIRTEVEELSSTTLNRRVPVPNTDDEVTRLARTMNGMLERLEAASTRQQEFVSDASHELRSPIASIRFDLEVALAHPELDSWRDVAARALSQTQRVEQIVDDLLLLARIGEDAAPAVAVVDIGGLVSEIASQTQGTRVELRVADGLFVNGRAAELTSMVRNLFDNAARHASSAMAATAVAEDQTVVLIVDDDGPGIPPADRERVFQRFTRLQPSRSRTDGGVGLGLAVVNRVVHHHSGTIAISDSPMGGARFKITIPKVSGNGT